MKIELKIEGIKCIGCVNRINNILANIKEIKKCDISLDEKNINLELKDEKVLGKIINTLNDLDFKILEVIKK